MSFDFDAFKRWCGQVDRREVVKAMTRPDNNN
jgi:hypothetical protein